MDKQRIQVYADPDLKRRIELAVTEYCLSAIMQTLTDDDLLEEVQVAIPVKWTQDKDLSADLRALQ